MKGFGPFCPLSRFCNEWAAFLLLSVCSPWTSCSQSWQRGAVEMQWEAKLCQCFLCSAIKEWQQLAAVAQKVVGNWAGQGKTLRNQTQTRCPDSIRAKTGHARAIKYPEIEETHIDPWVQQDEDDQGTFYCEKSQTPESLSKEGKRREP